MKQFYNGSLMANAHILRKEMTPWERKLWFLFLRSYPIRIYRQRILGPYIADYYCAKAKLIVELDGSQHFMPDGQDADTRRSEYLEVKGYSILRFPNIEIDRSFQAVCETIDREVRSRVHLTSSHTEVTP